MISVQFGVNQGIGNRDPRSFRGPKERVVEPHALRRGYLPSVMLSVIPLSLYLSVALSFLYSQKVQDFEGNEIGSPFF